MNVVKICCVKLYNIYLDLKKYNGKTISKHSWTFMHVPMITSWLVGGLIYQPTSSMWFFISWASNTNCFKSVVSLKHMTRPHGMIGHPHLKLLKFSVHMQLCPWLLNLSNGSQTRTRWMQLALFIFIIGWIFKPRKLSKNI